MNIKGLFAFAAVALAGLTNAEAENFVTRELQSDQTNSDFLIAINQKRDTKKLPHVCSNAKLAISAQSLAIDNAKRDKLNSTGLDGTTFSARISKTGIAFTSSAELMAAGQTTVSAVLETWAQQKNSFIYGDYSHVGLGYVNNATSLYKFYWVLDLAKVPSLPSC